MSTMNEIIAAIDDVAFCAEDYGGYPSWDHLGKDGRARDLDYAKAHLAEMIPVQWQPGSSIPGVTESVYDNGDGTTTSHGWASCGDRIIRPGDWVLDGKPLFSDAAARQARAQASEGEE